MFTEIGAPTAVLAVDQVGRAGGQFFLHSKTLLRSSASPSSQPTGAGTTMWLDPSTDVIPVVEPTEAPTSSNTAPPTIQPTTVATEDPTIQPTTVTTIEPTTLVTVVPTIEPSTKVATFGVAEDARSLGVSRVAVGQAEAIIRLGNTLPSVELRHAAHGVFPPTPATSFLAALPALRNSSFVLSGYDEQFTDPLYHSRFDSNKSRAILLSDIVR